MNRALTESDTSQPALLRSARDGAKAGFRWASYIAGPISAAAVLPGFAITAFGVGAGRSWTVPSYVPATFGLFVVAVVLGVILGTGLRVIGVRLGRDGARRPAASAEAAVDGPAGLGCGDGSPDTARLSAALTFVTRHWRGMAVVALLGPAAGFAVGAIAGRMVDRRLAAATAAADRDDPFWRIGDLMAHRESVPDVENSALVVGEALARVPGDWPPDPALPPGHAKSPTADVETFYEGLMKYGDCGFPPSARRGRFHTSLFL